MKKGDNAAHAGIEGNAINLSTIPASSRSETKQAHRVKPVSKRHVVAGCDVHSLGSGTQSRIREMMRSGSIRSASASKLRSMR